MRRPGQPPRRVGCSAANAILLYQTVHEVVEGRRCRFPVAAPTRPGSTGRRPRCQTSLVSLTSAHATSDRAACAARAPSVLDGLAWAKRRLRRDGGRDPAVTKTRSGPTKPPAVRPQAGRARNTIPFARYTSPYVVPCDADWPGCSAVDDAISALADGSSPPSKIPSMPRNTINWTTLIASPCGM